MKFKDIFKVSVKIFRFMGINFEENSSVSNEKKQKILRLSQKSLFWLHVSFLLAFVISSLTGYFDGSVMLERQIESMISFILILVTVMKAFTIWWNRIMIGKLMKDLERSFCENNMTQAEKNKSREMMKVFKRFQTSYIIFIASTRSLFHWCDLSIASK